MPQAMMQYAIGLIFYGFHITLIVKALVMPKGIVHGNKHKKAI